MAYDVLDTAKKLGWTEASGLKPGEYFASTGQTDAFRAEKLKDSGGTVGGYTGAAPTVPAATTTAAPTTTTAAPVTSTSGKGLMGGIGAGSYADKWGLTSDQVAQLAAMTNFQLGAGGGGNAGGQVGADGKAVGGLGKALEDMGVTDPRALLAKGMVPGGQAGWTPTAATDYTSRNQSTLENVADVYATDSPLMEQARTRGLQSANRRGLLNSSIATNAAEAAALDVALPIGSQDASQNAQNNLSNQNYLQNKNLQTDQISGNIFMQGRDIAGQNWRAQLGADTQERIAGMQVGANDREKIGALIASAQQNYNSTFQAIMNNPDIPAEQRDSYMAHATAMLQNSLNLVESMYGVKLDWVAPETPTAASASADASAKAGQGGTASADASWVVDYYGGDGDGASGGDAGSGGDSSGSAAP